MKNNKIKKMKIINKKIKINLQAKNCNALLWMKVLKKWKRNI